VRTDSKAMPDQQGPHSGPYRARRQTAV